MPILLSFRTMITFPVVATQLLSASKDVPFTSDASPVTATTFSRPPILSRAKASPSATEMATPACPATAASAGDSAGFGKPEIPPNLRSVLNDPSRPVSSFQAYAWCPTSHTTRSCTGSNTSARAIAISTAPREDARWPPFSSTVSQMTRRISSAVTRRLLSACAARNSHRAQCRGRARKSRARERR